MEDMTIQSNLALDPVTGFLAYPANPPSVGDLIDEAIRRLKLRSFPGTVSSWREVDIAGRFIIDGVLEKIDQANLFIADITQLNFNVTYELGYAIGSRKRVLIVKHSAFPAVNAELASLGIYDTLGYKEYANADGLEQLLRSANDLNAISISDELNSAAPVYINFSKHKSDQDSLIRYRVKKAHLMFRNFDPNETPRLSGPEAIRNVAQSYGVALHLVPPEQVDAFYHNLRAAFIAGIAEGLGKELLLIQYSEAPVPIDCRDAVTYCKFPGHFEDAIADFAGRVLGKFQSPPKALVAGPESTLGRLSFGSSTAENELTVLGDYYLEIDAYRRALRSEVRLVTGRKGSGKTAIFFQLRDRVRSNRANVVLDLKPDGYQLLKFKDEVLRLLASGTVEHTITAFWEYLLLLEICYKLIEKDAEVHKRDHRLFEPYQRLLAAYRSDEYVAEGDFSERLNRLLHHITEDFQAKYASAANVSLSQPQITDLLYRHDVAQLRKHVHQYLQFKAGLWLLFDNVDKGWATHGLKQEDLIIIRTLLDATRKIERDLDKQGVPAHTIVFLRNDVYELLIDATPDRGKETRANVDWSESELLRELIQRRVVHSSSEFSGRNFTELWPMLCVPLIKGEESSQYLVDRCLMRPRYLIELLNHCRGYAVNLNHERIQEQDVKSGLKAYSTDLLRDINLEIRDVEPTAEDAPYGFIGAATAFSETELNQMLIDGGVHAAKAGRVYSMLLWFGFLGVIGSDSEPKYIYSFNYDFKLFNATIDRQRKTGISYQVNPAFWAALGIGS
jgi:hypothetical protein